MAHETGLRSAFERAWNEYQTQLLGGAQTVLSGKARTQEALSAVIVRQRSLWHQTLRAAGLFRRQLRDASEPCAEAFELFIENELGFDLPLDEGQKRPVVKWSVLGAATAAGVAACVFVPAQLWVRIALLVAPCAAASSVTLNMDRAKHKKIEQTAMARLRDKLASLKTQALAIVGEAENALNREASRK